MSLRRSFGTRCAIYPISITLEGETPISTAILTNEIAPYLQALRDIQEVHDLVVDKEFVEPKIIQIHNELPKISADGLGDAIRAADEVWTPNRRRQSAEARDLENQRQRIENEARRDEAAFVAEKRRLDRIEDGDERRLEIQILEEELKQKQIETEMKLVELQAKKIENLYVMLDLADEIFERWGANQTLLDLGEQATAQLLSALLIVTSSPRGLRIGSHDNPRPTTLPGQPSTG